MYVPFPILGSVSIVVRLQFLVEKLSGFWIVSLVEGVWTTIEGDTGEYSRNCSSLESPIGD
jgi:hypothetical protein